MHFSVRLVKLREAFCDFEFFETTYGQDADLQQPVPVFRLIKKRSKEIDENDYVIRILLKQIPEMRSRFFPSTRTELAKTVLRVAFFSFLPI